MNFDGQLKTLSLQGFETLSELCQNIIKWGINGVQMGYGN